nr:ABC transporter permease [uncultured Alloprevotella sp.]
MKQFFSFVLKEAKHILRDKRTMLMLFGMPIMLMLLFGFAVTNDVRNVRTIVVASSIDYATQQATKRLAASDYFTILAQVSTPAEAEREIRAQRADMAVVFSPQFAGKHGQVQFIVDACDPNQSQQWTSYATNVLFNPAQSLVNIKLLYNPQMRSAYNFVPAIMGMLLMLICAMMTSISIVREKERGTMEIVLVSPTKPLLIILAKVVPYLVISIAILAIILLLSAFVLAVPIAGSLWALLLISGIYILLGLSLGLLVSNLAKTQFVALSICSMVVLTPILMLSGMIFPLESMGQVLQWISIVIPTRYYISAMRKLMIMGVGIDQVLSEIIILTSMLILLLTLSLATFKKRLES